MDYLNQPNRRNDIPYELQMKRIIEDYRKLLDAKDKLTAYAKRLERKVERLEEERARQGFVNARQGEKNTELKRKCKRLNATIGHLRHRINILVAFIKENELTPPVLPEEPKAQDEQEDEIL